MKLSLLALTLLAFPGAATSQTLAPKPPVAPAPPVAAPLAPADQNALDRGRALERNELLWDKPLDWNETGASLSSIVAHVQTLLGEGAPRLGVRSPTATKSTFKLSKSPIGPTLVCLAQLSNCRVWVFFDHLVVAPEDALKDEERAAIERGEGGDWMLSSAGKSGSSERWSGRDFQNRIVSRIVGEDIKTRLAAKGAPVPIPVPAPPPLVAGGRIITMSSTDKAPFELPFGELQPASQRVLQEMVDERVKGYSGSSKESALSPSVVVCFDDTKPKQLRLFLRGTTFNSFIVRWEFRDK